MTARTMRPSRRLAATLVEFAFVAIIFFMFLFGIVEWGRLVMTMNIMDNSVREGARLAVVSSTQGTNLTSLVQTEVDNRLAGIQGFFSGYNKTTSITVKAVNAATGAQLLDSSNNAIPPEGTQFSQSIQVQLTCNYQTLLPTFLLIPSSITLTSTSVMGSEAN